MKKLEPHRHFILAVAALISVMATPIAVFDGSLLSWCLYPSLMASAIFMYDLFKFVRNANEHLDDPFFKRSHLEFYKKLLKAFPFELFLFIPGLKLLGLLSLCRIHSLKEGYRDLALEGVNFRSYRVGFIFIGVVMVIHLVACTWMSINDMSSYSTMEAYVRSVYWAVTTLTTTGYGDITPTNNTGRIFTVFVMLGGFSAFGIIVGNISNILMAKNRLNEANKEKMENLSLFMHHYRIPLKLQSEVFRFYNHKMNKRLSENDALIVADLPLALQSEVYVYMKIKLISELPVFYGLPLSCLMRVCQALEQVSFSANQDIIKKGDAAEEMYIIDHGEVHVMNDDGRTIAILKHGQCFGEIALLMELKRTAKVVAASYCDAYRFKKSDFQEISASYPELESNFRKIIQKRTFDKKAA